MDVPSPNRGEEGGVIGIKRVEVEEPGKLMEETSDVL